jgi:hypothetical protein
MPSVEDNQTYPGRLPFAARLRISSLPVNEIIESALSFDPLFQNILDRVEELLLSVALPLTVSWVGRFLRRRGAAGVLLSICL